ncbi:MAG: hypothetical protein IKV57_07030 [Clostridia bacterium]|nr:hypothetical protein [Clostridia bacterium]
MEFISFPGKSIAGTGLFQTGRRRKKRCAEAFFCGRGNLWRKKKRKMALDERMGVENREKPWIICTKTGCEIVQLDET